MKLEPYLIVPFRHTDHMLILNRIWGFQSNTRVSLGEHKSSSASNVDHELYVIMAKLLLHVIVVQPNMLRVTRYMDTILVHSMIIF